MRVEDRMFSLLMSGGSNILDEVSKLFDHHKCDVSDVATNVATSPEFAEVAVISSNSRRVLSRVRGRLHGLRSIISVGTLGTRRSIYERLVVMGLHTGTTRHNRVVSITSVFETGVMSIRRSYLVVRLANARGGLRTFLGLLGSCRVLRLTEAKVAKLSENDGSITFF